MRWILTERAGPRVARRPFGDGGEAVAELERRARELAATAPGEAVDLRIRRIEAADRVVARLELAGPQRLVPTVRVGVDVHGDGSVQAFRGRVHRRPLVSPGGASAYDALRRVIRDR